MIIFFVYVAKEPIFNTILSDIYLLRTFKAKTEIQNITIVISQMSYKTDMKYNSGYITNIIKKHIIKLNVIIFFVHVAKEPIFNTILSDTYILKTFKAKTKIQNITMVISQISYKTDKKYKM